MTESFVQSSKMKKNKMCATKIGAKIRNAQRRNRREKHEEIILCANIRYTQTAQTDAIAARITFYKNKNHVCTCKQSLYSMFVPFVVP